MIISTIIFWAFVVWAAVQLLYALYFFVRISAVSTIKSGPSASEKKSVSVIICAKNEAENLEKNLPLILNQKYKDAEGSHLFEVIVVNDASTDHTVAVVAKYRQQYNHLTTVVIPPEHIRKFKGKKHALSIGIAHAAHEHLLLIDADCHPASNQWLAKMVAPLAGGKEIVAGHGAYHKTHNLLNAFIRWETINSFIQGTTYALAGKPYMAVGRNMACTKAILQKAQESAVWNISSSGDDDLVVNLYGTPHNYAIVSDQSAFTYTHTPELFKDWIKQKQRHLTDGKNYSIKVKYWLSTFGFTHAAVWVYFIALFFTHYRQQAVYIMAARCLIYWVLWAIAAIRLKEKSLIIWLPFFDMGWMLFNIAFSPYIILKNKQQWT